MSKKKKIIFCITIFALFMSKAALCELNQSELQKEYLKSLAMLQQNKGKEAAEYLNELMKPSFPFDLEPALPVYQSTNELPKICKQPVPENLKGLEKKKFIEKRNELKKKYEQQVKREAEKAKRLFYDSYPKGFKVGYYFYNLLGLCYLTSGDSVKAFDTFKISEKYMPKKYESVTASRLCAEHFFNMARACETLNRNDKAEEYCKVALNLCTTNDPVWSDIQITRTVIFEKKGNFEKCEKIYKMLYDKNLLKNDTDYVRYANLLFMLYKPEESYLYKEYMKVLGMLQKNKGKEAVGYLNKIMEPPFPYTSFIPAPEYQHVKKLIEQLEQGSPGNLNGKARESFERKSKKLKEKLLAELTEKEQAFYKGFPKEFKVGYYFYELLGMGYLFSGKPVEAYSTFLMSENCMPVKYANAESSRLAAHHFFNIGRTCGEMLNRNCDAENYCIYALELCSSNDAVWADILTTRTVILQKIGNYEQCAKIYKKLYSRNLLKTEINYVRYANVLFRLGRPREAFNILDDGLIMCSVQNNNIKDDLIINTILDRITLTTDDEIMRFYDTLGSLLGMLTPKSGMEKSIAFLINERSLLAKIFDYLTVENDLQHIKAEINSSDN